MNRKAILHMADSKYCYAVSEKTVEILLRVDKDDDFYEVNIVYGNKYDYYLKRQTEKMSLRFTDNDFNYYFVRLDLSDVRFVYVFTLKTNDEMIYYCEDGAVDNYDFSLAYFNSFQLPYINKVDVQTTVEWLKNAVFYQIFVDRFYVGNTSKDLSYVNLKWGEVPNPKSFAGGDLKGVSKKLSYLKKLGINAIYLTPVFKSKSNHKYDISDYFSIDETFGTKADLKNLVEKAHALGMHVVLDAVFNHCSEDLEQFKDVVKNGKDSQFFDWFMVRGDKVDKKQGNYEYFGVCKYMPKFNTSTPSLQQYLIKVATYWIRECDIDGWRLDVSDEVSHDFWKKLRIAVKKEKPSAVLIGENWHDAYPYLRGDEYDGIMNYALTKALMDYFVNDAIDAEGLFKRLSSLYVRNTRQANDMMLNLLDSHDTHRFYSLVKEDEDKLKAALAIVFCHTGSVCVYYGTEVPMIGGYDPDCRRTMDWSYEFDFSETGNVIQRLAEIKNRDVFKNGEIFYGADGNKFLLTRVYENKKITLTVTKDTVKHFIKGNVLASNNFDGEVLHGTGFVIEEETL